MYLELVGRESIKNNQAKIQFKFFVNFDFFHLEITGIKFLFNEAAAGFKHKITDYEGSN